MHFLSRFCLRTCAQIKSGHQGLVDFPEASFQKPRVVCFSSLTERHLIHNRLNQLYTLTSSSNSIISLLAWNITISGRGLQPPKSKWCSGRAQHSCTAACATEGLVGSSHKKFDGWICWEKSENFPQRID